jgi:uncharacterized protein (TIGR04255 family)
MPCDESGCGLNSVDSLVHVSGVVSGASITARKYKRAPIKEALCAFNFAPISEWNFTVPGHLHSVIKDDYAGEPRNIAIQTFIPPGGPQSPNIGFQNEIRVQLPSLDNTKIVVVGIDMISLSVLQPYEGWEHFKPRIERVVSAYYEINRPKEVLRIGLRYINHISVPQARANAGEYFNVVPQIKTSGNSNNAAALHLSNFMHRSEYVADDDIKVIVTNAGLITAHPDKSEYVLDVDTIWDKEPIQDLARAMEVVEKLHTLEGGVFEGMIADKARSLFDGP